MCVVNMHPIMCFMKLMSTEVTQCRSVGIPTVDTSLRVSAAYDDDESCSLCLVALNEVDKVVKLPSCSHRICFKCAIALAERNKDEDLMFQCPCVEKNIVMMMIESWFIA